MNITSALGNGIERPALWSLRLLGGFELSALAGGERVALSGKRERVLLAYLALSPNGRQPRRKLAALLWGDATDEAPLDNLRTCVWGLRKALGDTGHRVIASEGDDITLDAAAFEVDALAFRRLAAQSDRTALEAAAELCCSEFLDGLDIESEEFESWRRAEATRYRDQSIDVLTRLMTQLDACGEIERAIETGARILALEPLHETAARRLMRLYGRSGRRGAAVQIYRTLADALRSELDTEPEAETRLVFAELTRSGEERAGGPVIADAKPVLRSTAIARDAPVEPIPVMRSRLRTSLGILAAVLIVAVALLSYRQFASTVANSQTAVAERAVSTQASAIAIVVLPFANLSGDNSQEFFSDGMTEEITSALAKIPSLRVIARTSAFQFKGRNQDVRMIARSLGASHLIEGSVRKIDNRVRISAELIEASNGSNLWTESYERQLTDIFRTQEEIAQAIAAALRVPLGLQPGGALVTNRTSDLESYDQYLRAKALVRARVVIPDELIATLEKLVARDPNYAPAWALLSRAYALGSPDLNPQASSIEDGRRAFQSKDKVDKVELAARKAVQLDSRQASAYATLATVQYRRGKWAAAEDLYKQGLALDPNDPDILYGFSVLLRNVGRSKEGLSVSDRVRTLEPLSSLYQIGFARALQVDGQDQESIAVLEALPPNYPGNMYLAQAYATAERYGEAADTLLAMPQPTFNRRSLEDAARLLRGAPAKVKSPEALPLLEGELNFVYASVGAMNRVMEYPERNLEIGIAGDNVARTLWRPNYAPLRKTKRFKAYVRKAGLVNYWRARGWPDLCHPVGADDFACA
jgi:TolB-like protein/DNA-binding SARP family transcriptional activator/cytochrome c-type biogenesis protein CcmH/NrfG